MSKTVQFRQASRGIQLVLTHRDSYFGRVRSRRTFTVDEFALKRALKDAGLYETVEVPAQPPTTVEEQMRLANEIAWYDSIKDRVGGTPTVASQREKLWGRITKKMGLST